jgi:hypothetical protein
MPEFFAISCPLKKFSSGDVLVQGLVPVPGTHAQYNTAFDLAESYRTERLPFETISDIEAKRLARGKWHLIEWLDHNASSNP